MSATRTLFAGVAALLLLAAPMEGAYAQSSSTAKVTSVQIRNFDIEGRSGGRPRATDAAAATQIVGSAEPVSIEVRFDQQVTITGRPQVVLTVGTQQRYALIDMGSSNGGSRVYFNYWVEAADYDMDGIEIADAGLILNGGTITYDRTAANLNLDGAIIDISDDSGRPLKVNGGLRSDKVSKLGSILWVHRVDPTPDLDKPDDGAFRRGDEIEFVVYAEPPVTVTGTPRVKLLVGENGASQTTRYADYEAARSYPDRLSFSYTVQAEDSDSDGITVPARPYSLNGGTIVTHGGTTPADLSQPLSPFRGGPVRISSLRVHGGSGPVPWRGASIYQAIFASSPQVGGTYRRGEKISVALFFRNGVTRRSEALTVTGTPQLGLTIGSQTRQANYDANESASTDRDRYWQNRDRYTVGSYARMSVLVFSYTVQAADLDADGISIAANALTLNGGTITLARDATVAAELEHSAVAADPTRKVDGGGSSSGGTNPGGGTNQDTPPRVNAVGFTGTPASENTYRLGEQIRVAVTFSEAVTVMSTPQLDLIVGPQTRPAYYDASRSEGSLLVFTYRVQGADDDPDGISIAAGAITLNGGTISRAGDPTTAASVRHAGVGTDDTRKVNGFTGAVEHGNSREQATLLVLSARTTGEVGETGGGDDLRVNVAAERGAEVAGALEQWGDIDYFRVEVPAAGRLTVETTGATDTAGALEGATGQLLTHGDNGGMGSNFRLERPVQAGTYYVVISEGYVSITEGENGRGIGPYTLAVRFTPVGGGTPVESVVPAPRDNPPATGGGSGAGAEQSRPAVLRVNTETRGMLERAGEVDYFLVEVQAAGTVRVEASGAAAPAAYFGAGNAPLLPQGAGGRATQAAWPVTVGIYHVAVVGGATRTRTGAYTLAVRFTAASEAGPLRATLLNVAPAQAWVHFYCGRAQAAEAVACTAQVQCGPQDGVPVAWDVEVAPETIFSYWPGRTMADGTSADFAAALVTAGRPEAEARQRTTCRVFSPDPLEVRAYTRIGRDVVPVAQSPAPLDTTAPTHVATLLNVAPAQALVHLSCRKAPAAAGEPADPCQARLQCGQREGTPVAWEVAVAAETTLTYGPGGTTDDLATALVAAGKTEAEARRRTTCQVFSRDPLDAWAYTRVGGDLVSVTNPPAAVDAGAPTRVATLLNVAPAQAWVHFYCRKAHDPAAETVDPCNVRLQCGQRAGAPVAWDVEVAPETIATYWPGRTTADGASADFAAALVAAGKTEAEARRRTTCQVFSTDPVDVRGYTQVGGAVVPVANPPVMPAADAPLTRIGTLLNLSPAQAWVHFYCRKAHQPEAETVDPCDVRLQCGQQAGPSVGWDVEVPPETIVSYWPGRTAADGTSDNLAVALVAAGKTEAAARRRTTCQVFSADPVDVRGYTQLGETVIPVKN